MVYYTFPVNVVKGCQATTAQMSDRRACDGQRLLTARGLLPIIQCKYYCARWNGEGEEAKKEDHKEPEEGAEAGREGS